MKKCPYCGTLLEDNAQFCSNCNAPLGITQFPQQNTNYSVFNNNQQNPYLQIPNYGMPAQHYQPNSGNANYPQQQFYNRQQLPNGPQMSYNNNYTQPITNPENNQTTKKKSRRRKKIRVVVVCLGL